MKSSDPYLILRPRFLVCDAPKKLLPFLDTVKRLSAWTALGFSAKLDQYGYPLLGTSKAHEFSVARESDPTISEAIRTGKKALRHPPPVFDYVLAGCELSEFVDLSDDVIAYCQGNLYRINGQPDEALPLLAKACHLNPDGLKKRHLALPQEARVGRESDSASHLRAA